MAGMTDTAFRRLVKRHGGCGLVVTEMVSSEGLVRGIDRTLEYAEYTEEERPISIQIFGGDPEKMAAAAQIVEGMGADIVDVNMGCPVPKIAKHNAGCSLMREPEHAASVIAAMTKAVKIPVTVKMRAGWNDDERNAPTLAQDGRGRRRRRRDRARPHGRAELQRIGGLGSRRRHRDAPRDSCVRQRRLRRTGADRRAACGRASKACSSGEASCAIPGFSRRRPTLRRAGRARVSLPPIAVSSCSITSSCCSTNAFDDDAMAVSHDRWVINKLRALGSYYTKGLENGSHLRTKINAASSLSELRGVIADFFFASVSPAA